MSKLVNISDELYEELTSLKKVKNESYTQVIEGLLRRVAKLKTTDWNQMVLRAKERDARFKGKKERIDHDLIAYGVSRDSP